MKKKEIEQGAGRLLAAVRCCEEMVNQLRAAVYYCYEQEKAGKDLTAKGYAGLPGFTISGQRESRTRRRCSAGAQSPTAIWRKAP